MYSKRTSYLALYDLCNAENITRMTESSHKNVIYSITQNVTNFVHFIIN